MCFWGNCPNFGPNTGFWDHNFKKNNFEFESQKYITYTLFWLFNILFHVKKCSNYWQMCVFGLFFQFRVQNWVVWLKIKYRICFILTALPGWNSCGPLYLIRVLARNSQLGPSGIACETNEQGVWGPALKAPNGVRCSGHFWAIVALKTAYFDSISAEKNCLLHMSYTNNFSIKS